jgi:hypothetical protein
VEGQEDGTDQEDAAAEHDEEAGEQGNEEDGEDVRRFPNSPRRGKAGTTRYGAREWGAIDNLTINQYARMPMGMHTMDYIPNPLQEEWTEA